MAESAPSPPSSSEQPAARLASGEQPRRGFFVKFAAAAIGAVVTLVPLITGLLFFLNPLYKKKPAEPGGQGPSDGGIEKDEEGYINLKITADALPGDGTPRSYKVLDDKVDAWNKYKNVEIGTVWLRRIGDQVIAFSTVCPHLGCAIDFRRAESDFYCPCHTSRFTLDGERSNQIPPRDMDELSVKQHPETGEIWLKYQKFRATIPKQKPI